ncbi:aldose epimerase family protein [Yersinia massiliensis]|uniref:aldose epimerase family protein n=1 Tax=Yersinia massiliensis TaxID=419257 RepID=UPI001CFEFC94|nr:aldose epimerase family protein [Yersinia massiliensis]MCB5309815.1 galactose mutarotase [Yersinia massiliensis]
MTTIQRQPFGKHQGQEVSLYTLTNKAGMRLCVTNYGCIITQLWVPDRHGQVEDIVMGFDDLPSYQAGHPFFGAIAGRCANRIAGGRFKIDGQEYVLATNELPTGQHLHGGLRGFDKYVWQVEEDGDGLIFSRTSPDGEEGYPGHLHVRHRIGLTESNVMTFHFEAETDQPTIVNLVNHSHYNLRGHTHQIHDQQLKIESDFMTPVDEVSMLPTGEIRRVAGTAFDFRHARRLGDAMQQRPAQDFDMNYVIRQSNDSKQINDSKQNADASPTLSDTLQPAAMLICPHSGRVMEVHTTLPGIQFYNAFKLSNKVWNGKAGHRYQAFSGICLETQAFPDSIHHAHFSEVILRPGQKYQSCTEHRFSVVA